MRMSPSSSHVTGTALLVVDTVAEFDF